ncbi:MAG: S9 family peptidase [Sulfolobales archaeon]
MDEIEVLVKRYLSIRQAVSGRYGRFDGSIYYLSDLTGEHILWRAIKRNNGYLHDIVFPWDRRIGSYTISPSGYIAFTTDRDGDERWSIYVAKDNNIRLVSGENGSINNIGEWSSVGRYLSFASNMRNGVDFDLYVYDLYTGEKQLILENEGIISPSKWLNEELLLAVKMHTYQDTDILLIDRINGSSINLTKHSGEAQNISPRPINQRFFVFLTNIDEEFRGVAIYDLEKREWRYIAKENWDIELVDYWNKYIAYVVNEDGASVVKIYDLENGRSRELIRVWGSVDDIDFYDGRIILSLNSPKHGLEIFALDLNGLLERVTYSPKNNLSEDEFVSPERFIYRSFDGLEIHGLYYKPHKPLRDPPPALIYLHGGPESQQKINFDVIHQAILSLGIAIAAPNYRGSSGYGKTFIHLDDVDKRINAIHDVYYAIEYLSKKNLVDPSRLCVMGRSYGGYLTLMMLSMYPDVWRCGVEVVGIVNLLTFIRNTGAWRRKYRIVEYGDPEIHRDIMIKLSPITYVDRIKAPLMIVHGARDNRVPVSEADQLVEALSRRGIKVSYIRLDDEGHIITKVRNRIRVYTEAIRFIYDHLSK